MDMGLEKIFAIAVTLAVLAASTGQLPRVIKTIQVAQLQILKQSQTSEWGKAFLIPIRN
jgi:hypothetical protein